MEAIAIYGMDFKVRVDEPMLLPGFALALCVRRGAGASQSMDIEACAFPC